MSDYRNSDGRDPFRGYDNWLTTPPDCDEPECEGCEERLAEIAELQEVLDWYSEHHQLCSVVKDGDQWKATYYRVVYDEATKVATENNTVGTGATRHEALLALHRELK